MIAAFRQMGQRLGLPDVMLLKAKALLALEPPDLDAVHVVLTEARAVAKATGWQRDLWRLLALLANIEKQHGNKGTATDLHHEARTILEYIIEHIPKGKLRTSFEALPEVKAII